MIWVVIANSNDSRIYHYDKNHSHLTLIKEINHPELKLKTSEIFTSDRPGKYKSNNSAHGAYSPHMDPKEVEIDKFSREIALELNKGRNAHAYDKLILITPPHMNGLIYKHLNQHVKNLVINNIQKDLQHFNDHELLNFLKSHTQYPDTSG